MTELQEKFIECISLKFAKGKRPHELLVLKAILDNKVNPFDYMTDSLTNVYCIDHKEKTIINVANNLTNEFATGSSKKTYEACLFIEKINNIHMISSIFSGCLQDDTFRKMVGDLVELGLYRNKKYYGNIYKNSSLQLYQKYTYEDVCRLLEWEKNVVSLNIGGYKYDDKSKTFPVFINYHKADDISDTIKYEDRFISNERLIAISKAKRTIDSNDVVTFYNAKKLGVTIELFVRKHKKDEGSKEF